MGPIQKNFKAFQMHTTTIKCSHPGGSGLDEPSAEAGCVEVGQGQQHRRESPFEAAAGADDIEGDVGGQVAPHEVADVNAGAPDQADHGGTFPLLRTANW